MERGKGVRILSLDPSLTATGWAVLQNDVVLSVGCIKTETSGKRSRVRKSDDRMRRVSEINKVLCEVIHTNHIQYIVSELPHGSQSAVAAIALGLICGTIQGIADSLDIGLEWFSEGDSKRGLLGKASATKCETIQAVSKYYTVPWTNVGYRDEAVADAISVYHVAKQQSPTIKFLK